MRRDRRFDGEAFYAGDGAEIAVAVGGSSAMWTLFIARVRGNSVLARRSPALEQITRPTAVIADLNACVEGARARPRWLGARFVPLLRPV